MSVVLEIVSEVVKIGMEAYRAAQADEAQALVLLDAALASSRVRVSQALAALDAARNDADDRIAKGFKGKG